MKRTDRTMNTAIGNVNKEWNEMTQLAIYLRENNRLKPEWVEEQQQKFTGIFKRLLTDPIDELKKDVKKKG